MMKNISNLDLLLKAASTVSTPVFADLYEQNKPGLGLSKTPTTAQLKEIYGKAYKEGYLRGEREARANAEQRIEQELKYVGFTIGGDFVVGYGLDVNERYRNLDAIYTFVGEA
jgi:hypothetical protein